jgi:DNA-binding LacI/PurR family transcriptional regulator
MPSEATLVRQLGASRITVGRAVRELKERGLVERIAGSGTYVRKLKDAKATEMFGLLIPDLGTTEIFDPICQGMAGAPEAVRYALLWGNAKTKSDSKEEQSLALARQYVERHVAGIFFAPLELTPRKDEVNMSIIQMFERARIPVVLLDRCLMPFPRRSRHDLVGIDNRRAGYLITEHLLNLGARRIVFVAHPNATATVQARITGFAEAIIGNGLPFHADFVRRIDLDDEAAVRDVVRHANADAIIGVNDRTAGRIMQTALQLGMQVPRDLRIAGIDDVEYAKLLPVPLTTIRQPCRDIGRAAMTAMIERMAHPEMLPRDIYVDCKLIVRDSCGAPKA